MRSIFAAALLAVSFSASAADMVARMDKNSVRLTQEPCPQSVLVHVPQGSRGYFRKANAVVEGKDFLACWATRSDGLIALQYEDGDGGLLPIGMFKQEDGV